MSFGAIAAVVAVAGAAVGAAGAVSSAGAQADAAKYNAAVESNNAGAAAQQAKFNAQQIQDKTRRQVAQQRAAMAASGFDANSGTFIDVTNSTKRAGELDKLSAIYQGRLGVNRSISAGQLDESQANNAGIAGAFGATSSILGGLSRATSIMSNPSFRSGGEQ